MKIFKIFLIVSLIVVLLFYFENKDKKEYNTDNIYFIELKNKTETFISYYYSIKIDEKEDAILRKALGNIPAPCCADYPAYTCCCECNLKRTIHGLSKYLLKQNLSADDITTIVLSWIEFVNPAGFTGDSCYIGNCEKPFYKNGCGGMEKLVI